MVFATPGVENSPNPGLPSARQLDREMRRSEASAGDYSPPDQLACGSGSDAELEELYLIELRYRQHLAQRAQQELFESGMWGNLER